MLCYGYTVLYGPPGLVNLYLHPFFASLFGSSTYNVLNLDFNTLHVRFSYAGAKTEQLSSTWVV